MEARHLLAVVLLMLVSLDAVALAVDNVEDFYACLAGIKPYIGGELMYCCSVRCDCGEDDCCK